VIECRSYKNPNDEIRNPKEDRNPNTESAAAQERIRASSFGFPSCFDIRPSDFFAARKNDRGHTVARSAWMTIRLTTTLGRFAPSSFFAVLFFA
jgi:hypothetical protein